MTDRTALIRANMHKPSKALSPAASDLNDCFQELLSDTGNLDPAEQLRLLNGLIFQMSGQVNKLI